MLIIIKFCYTYKHFLWRSKLCLTSNSCLRHRTRFLDAFLQCARHFSAYLQHQAKQREEYYINKDDCIFERGSVILSDSSAAFLPPQRLSFCLYLHIHCSIPRAHPLHWHYSAECQPVLSCPSPVEHFMPFLPLPGILWIFCNPDFMPPSLTDLSILYQLILLCPSIKYWQSTA